MEASLDVPIQSETGLCCQATVTGSWGIQI